MSFCLGSWNNFDIENCNPIYSYKKYNHEQSLELIKTYSDLSIPIKVQHMRDAGIIHKKARRFAQSIVKPNVKIFDICTSIDKKITELSGQTNNIIAGIGFPVGCSINHCAAHDSAVPNDVRILKNTDVVKIDIGTHIQGIIVDSAFTIAFDEKYNPLLQATYDATWSAIKMAGCDAFIDDISNEIQTVIESYELDYNNNIYPIYAIKNLGGHTIEPYKIHAGKLLLCSNNNTNKRMTSGECWAIETFATTSQTGLVHFESSESTHFMLNHNYEKKNFKLNLTRKLQTHIINNYSTLPFCTRWLNTNFGSGYRIGLKELCSNKIVEEYPPLYSGTKNDMTSQFEHTIYLHDYGKEIISYGPDY